jgi:ASC-1-like (ASCH) protein
LSRLTLRIKQVYFDQIRTGEKTYELRSNTEYYRRMLEGREYSQLMLHYQRPQRLYAKIKSIRLIDTPAGIDRKVITTDKCWRIDVSNPRFRYEG